jgi:hypothetical protein
MPAAGDNQPTEMKADEVGCGARSTGRRMMRFGGLESQGGGCPRTTQEGGATSGITITNLHKFTILVSKQIFFQATLSDC